MYPYIPLCPTMSRFARLTDARPANATPRFASQLQPASDLSPVGFPLYDFTHLTP